MRICIKINGHWHCFYIPIVLYPIDWPLHGPPGNYDGLFQDAIILASAQNAVAKISDQTVRAGVENAIKAGFAAMQKRAGSDVRIEAPAAK
jgi:hypothetical protein